MLRKGKSDDVIVERENFIVKWLVVLDKILLHCESVNPIFHDYGRGNLNLCRNGNGMKGLCFEWPWGAFDGAIVEADVIVLETTLSFFSGTQFFV